MGWEEEQKVSVKMGSNWVTQIKGFLANFMQIDFSGALFQHWFSPLECLVLMIGEDMDRNLLASLPER